MKENQDKSITGDDLSLATPLDGAFEHFLSPDKNGAQNESKIRRTANGAPVKNDDENILIPIKKTKTGKQGSDLLLRKPPEIKSSATSYQNAVSLFRLFVKNGEYVYARPNDIIMMESCDHLVKVYLAFNDKIKKTIRHNTLKDFLLQLPQEQFVRIGRFCAVNIQRLTGGNCNEQTFEFDFRVSVKLKHAISHTAFYTLGK